MSKTEKIYVTFLAKSSVSLMNAYLKYATTKIPKQNYIEQHTSHSGKTACCWMCIDQMANDYTKLVNDEVEACAIIGGYDEYNSYSTDYFVIALGPNGGYLIDGDTVYHFFRGDTGAMLSDNELTEIVKCILEKKISTGVLQPARRKNGEAGVN